MTERDRPASAWLLESYERLDPVTFRVMGGALVSACREMGTTMMRTAYSPIFVDGMDFSCGILDAAGEMIGQGEFCPVHLNSMAYSAQWGAMEHGFESLAPGDVLIHNDPHRGGTHLNDFNVIKPMFYEGELIGFACNRAHQIDMGGKARAGFAGDATDIFQEGTRVPPIKWYSRGVEVTDIADYLFANVRQPYIQRGDLTAQLASCRTAERRVAELCDRYGMETVVECFDAMKDYSERLMRSVLAEIPDGEWFFEDYLDHDGIRGEPVRIASRVKVRDDQMTVDFSESSPQVDGPINATYGITASMVFTALLQIADPDIPVNHGCFRPVTIIAPRGTITNAQFPAATMGGNTVTSMAIYQCVSGALAQALPARGIAASYNSHHFTGGGRNDRGTWLFYFFTDGGWGAIDGADGWNGMFQANGNCRDYPAEVIESTLPLRYEAVRLRPDLAGAGKYRGGCGTERIITFLEDGEVNEIGERHDFRPYGLAGGRAAGPNDLILHRDGESRSFDVATGARFPLKFANRRVQVGDSVSIVSTGGGGYGPPLERDPAKVLEDVLDEFCSIEDARRLYGVVIRASNGELAIDLEATASERGSRPRDVRDVDRGPVTWPSKVATGPTDEGVRATARVNRLRELRPDPFCTSECPLQGDPRRCPLFNDEALRFWTTDNIVRWLQRHCPKSDVFAELFEVAHRY